MRIYVASPLGFSEAGRMFLYDRLLPALRNLGYLTLDPWAISEDLQTDPSNRQQLDSKIAKRNVEAIDSADGLMAVLDGADVDSGTAAEIGYAFACRLPMVAYRGDSRVIAEKRGAIINLQVEYFICANGGRIIQRLDDLPDAVLAVFGIPNELPRTEM